MLTTNLIYFAISCLVLVISGIYLVKSLTKIAKFLGISEFSAAFIIMAFATSIPELFVGVSSALSGNPTLSLGNIIGANILDLTLITGIIVLINKDIKIKSQKIGKDIYLMLITILMVLMLYTIGQSLSRIDGVILLGFFLIHTYRVFRKRKKYPKKMKNGKEHNKRFWWLLIFLLALVGLFISSNFVVKYSSEIATDLKLPDILIGLFLLSFATTLPELVFGISASNLKHEVMAIGDQIGTVITNSALVLGIVAIISPIQTDFLTFIVPAVFMFISAFILVTFILTGRRLEKIEGVSLILMYVLFIIITLFVR